VLCFIASFVFILCLVYPMLPVSLDCLFVIGSSVFSNVYLVLWLMIICNMYLDIILCM